MKTLWLPSLAVLLIALAFPGPVSAQAQADAPGAQVLATQELDSGIVVEITEFRRKGNTLTVQVRFRNNGANARKIWLGYERQVYLLDAQGGKRYLVLYANHYIAAGQEHWPHNFWEREINVGQTTRAWMKFPAPPASVKQISLVLGIGRPFDDLPIQDD